MELKNSDFTKGITEANQMELVVINYEIILINIKNASKYLVNKDYVNYYTSLNSAKDFLLVLMKSLDMQYEISFELLDIYIAVNQTIINAFFKKDEKHLILAYDIMFSLGSVWKKIVREANMNKEARVAFSDTVDAFLYKNGKYVEVSYENPQKGIIA